VVSRPLALFPTAHILQFAAKCKYAIPDLHARRRLQDPSVIEDYPYEFLQPPAPGQVYPYKLGLAADIGQTSLSEKNMNVLIEGLDGLENNPVFLLGGDLSYADGFNPRWDTWSMMFEPLISKVQMLTCPGNHEVRLPTHLGSQHNLAIIPPPRHNRRRCRRASSL